MNEKPEPRGVPAGRNVAQQYSTVAGVRSPAVDMLNSFVKTRQGMAASLTGIKSPAAEMLNSFAKTRQGLSASFAGVRSPAAEMLTSYTKNHGLAAQLVETFASAPGLSVQLAGMSGARALVQGLATRMSPWRGISLINTVGPLPQVDFLPPTLRNWDMSQVFRPLLETPEYRQLGEAGEDLAEWVEERFSGAETASPERFEEIAGRLETVELDEESEQQLECMAQDETALQAGARFLGIQRYVPQTLGGVLALSAAVSIAVSIMLILGMVYAPAQTEIIVENVGKGLAAGGGTYMLAIRFSPRARAQLDAMKRTDPADSGETEEI